MATAGGGRLIYPCEVCKRPERVDTVKLDLVMGGSVYACGECGYELAVSGDLAGEDDEEAVA